MGDKDLEKIIAGIGADEQKIQQKEVQLQKYKQMVEKLRKSLDEKDQMIIQMQNEMKNKFDLPEDVEQLKAYIGELRGELNTKDNQLEMSYGRIAELEAEMKVTQSQMGQFQASFEKTYSQIGTIKTQLVEKQAELTYKDNMINELQMQVNNFDAQINNIREDYKAQMESLNKDWASKVSMAQNQMKEMEARYKKMLQDKEGDSSESYGQMAALKSTIAEKENEIMRLSGVIKEKEMDISNLNRQVESLNQKYDESNSKLEEISLKYNEDKSGIEKKLREDFAKQRSDFVDKIQDLEKQNLELTLKITDIEHTSGGAVKQYNDMKSKFDDIYAKYTAILEETKQQKEKIEVLEKTRDDLFEFKLQNESSVVNLKRLKLLFEKEPFFKIFNLVQDVGEVGIEEIKSALGIPTVTVQKYIQDFIKVELFELSESGKVTLKNK